MSTVYEERATMIAAGELQSFVPFGREHCRNHPNAVNLQLRQLQPASELWSSDGAAGLVGSLQEVTLQEKDKVTASHPPFGLVFREFRLWTLLYFLNLERIMCVPRSDVCLYWYSPGKHTLDPETCLVRVEGLSKTDWLAVDLQKGERLCSTVLK